MSRALSTFDPSRYDLDLKLRQVHGKGRGQGFDHEDFSVLGDDHYSPLVADRVVNVLKMFVDNEVIELYDVLIRLGIKPVEQQFDWLKGLEYIGKQDEKDREIRRLKRELQYLKTGAEEKAKSEKQKKRIVLILEQIASSKNLKTKIVLSDGSMKIEIKDLGGSDGKIELDKIFEKCSYDDFELLLNRLITKSSDIKMHLEMYSATKKKPKKIQELLESIDLTKHRFDES